MRYSAIRDMDISNGVGIACSIFFQGCSHHCKGCFNPETWDFDGGVELTHEIINEFIKMCNKHYIKCISILGGEPFDQNSKELYEFILELKKLNKPIYMWSGYIFEDLKNSYLNILSNIDFLIDGEFELENRDLRLKLRGSTNQRIIDVKKSLSNDKICVLED